MTRSLTEQIGLISDGITTSEIQGLGVEAVHHDGEAGDMKVRKPVGGSTVSRSKMSQKRNK